MKKHPSSNLKQTKKLNGRDGVNDAPALASANLGL